VTGEIYHLTFKPPPAEIVPRLVRQPCTLGHSSSCIASLLRMLDRCRLWCFPWLAHPRCRPSCLALRNSCCAPFATAPQVQRSDDTEEKARNRLRTYHANVDAVVGYYQDALVEVRPGLALRPARVRLQEHLCCLKRKHWHPKCSLGRATCCRQCA
jgi:adenylate kinase family enzyme